MSSLTHQTLTALPLGKTSQYPAQYDAALLQSVARSRSREPLGLTTQSLPFYGADIWTLYELSWLNAKGLPQVAIAHVTVDALSVDLIESKSFKLYLNSFNQTRFAHWQQVQQILTHDLAHCAQGKVDVELLSLEQASHQTITSFEGRCIDDQDIDITGYHLEPQWLSGATDNQTMVQETLVSHLLKSNCLITQQPDWGSIMIRYYGPAINPQALLRYLVSFRQHNEFHEPCVERIFHDIQQFCQPQQLTVYARYTRRGGIDINPWRANVSFTPDKRRLIRQ